MVKLRDKPFMWVTWLVDMMSGKVPCIWKYSFKALYEQSDSDKRPTGFDFTSWKMKHTRLLTELRKQLNQRGSHCYTEFQLKIEEDKFAIVGKADCIGENPDEVIYYDCKTGKPDDSHRLQVQLYMWLDRKNKSHPNKKLRGEVVYENYRLPVIEPNGNFEKELNYFIEQILNIDKSLKASGECCRDCDIMKKDCAERDPRWP